jgi:hypothetical protein
MDRIFNKGNGYKPNPKSEDIKAVITDKTNLFKCIHIGDYKNWAIKHLLKNGKEIPRDKLVQVFTDANELLESLEHMMSEDKYSYVHLLQSHSISKTTNQRPQRDQ